MKDYKKQAEDLINQYHPYCGGMEPMQTENAKKCATIHIEALMSQSQPYSFLDSLAMQWDDLYWIREEIINYTR